MIQSLNPIGSSVYSLFHSVCRLLFIFFTNVHVEGGLSTRCTPTTDNVDCGLKTPDLKIEYFLDAPVGLVLIPDAELTDSIASAAGQVHAVLWQLVHVLWLPWLLAGAGVSDAVIITSSPYSLVLLPYIWCESLDLMPGRFNCLLINIQTININMSEPRDIWIQEQLSLLPSQCIQWLPLTQLQCLKNYPYLRLFTWRE